MDGNGNQGSAGYVLFVWSPSGWTLEQREGEPPAIGATVEADEKTLRVTKLGPSPLPGDRRPCAYTEFVSAS